MTDKLLESVVQKFDPATHKFGMAYTHNKSGKVLFVFGQPHPRSITCFDESNGYQYMYHIDDLTRAPEHDLIPRKEVDALTKRNAELEAALKFYADPKCKVTVKMDCFSRYDYNGNEEYETKIVDRGEIAKEAIANNAGKDL